jgi:hypothetical protein
MSETLPKSFVVKVTMAPFGGAAFSIFIIVLAWFLAINIIQLGQVYKVKPYQKKDRAKWPKR